MQDAKDALMNIRAMKEMLKQLEAGEVLKADLLPPPLPPLSESAEPPQQEQKQNGLERYQLQRCICLMEGRYFRHIYGSLRNREQANAIIDCCC